MCERDVRRSAHASMSHFNLFHWTKFREEWLDFFLQNRLYVVENSNIRNELVMS